MTVGGIDSHLDTYIYGQGGFAKRLSNAMIAKGVNIKGFVSFLDNQEGALHPSYVSGPDTQILLGVFNHYIEHAAIVSQLREVGFRRIHSPSASHHFLGKGFETYYLSGDLEALPGLKEIESVINRLSDAESRDVLRGLHSYQTGGQLEALRRSGNETKQYLGTTLPSPFQENWLKGDVNFFDIGAYDGDTLRSMREYFPKDFPNFKLTCVEPDLISFTSLKSWCEVNKPDATLMHAAAGSLSKSVPFSSTGELSSKSVGGPQLSDSDNMDDSQDFVKVLRLDDFGLEFSPTHVKMDIEGAELEALQGFSSTLKTWRPKLAISLYHKPRDMVEIPEFLFSLLSNYAWFVRCYGAHGYDTILYGIPLD